MAFQVVVANEMADWIKRKTNEWMLEQLKIKKNFFEG